VHDAVLGALLAQLPAVLRSLAARRVGTLVGHAMRKDWGTTTVDDYLDNLRKYTLEGLE